MPAAAGVGVLPPGAAALAVVPPPGMNSFRTLTSPCLYLASTEHHSSNHYHIGASPSVGLPTMQSTRVMSSSHGSLTTTQC